jgi:hypothetical protein
MTDPLRSPSGRYIHWPAVERMLAKGGWLHWPNQPTRTVDTVKEAIRSGRITINGTLEYDWTNRYTKNGRGYADLWLRVVDKVSTTKEDK